MKGITFISDSRESMPLAYRIQQEGVLVHYFINDPTYRDNFKGIMPNITLSKLKDALNRSDTVIFDITLPMAKPYTPAHNQDVALLRNFGVTRKVPGVFGPIADKLMKTHKVIGSCSWCEHIELDRIAGFKIAQKIGLEIPEYHVFNSLKDGVKFLESHSDDKWVFKPLGNKDLDLTYPDTFKGELLDLMQYNLPDRFKTDKVKFILQKFVDGVEVSSEMWWDGKEFRNPNRTIEDKKLGAGNTGPATGSQSNLVWMCDSQDGIVFKEMQKLSLHLKLSGYLGPIDANCILTEDGKAWFLEWTPRCGWSALYCFCSLIPEGQLSSFFLNGFQAVFRDEFVASQLISIYPYPLLDKKHLDTWVKGNLINHPLNLKGMYWQDVYLDDQKKLRCCGSDGIVGVMTGVDKTPDGAIDKVKKSCEKMQITGNIQWRNDAKERHLKRLHKLKAIGVDF